MAHLNAVTSASYLPRTVTSHCPMGSLCLVGGEIAVDTRWSVVFFVSGSQSAHVRYLTPRQLLQARRRYHVRCALCPALFLGHIRQSAAMGFTSGFTSPQCAGLVRERPLSFPAKTKLRENRNSRPVAVTLTPEPCNLSGP